MARVVDEHGDEYPTQEAYFNAKMRRVDTMERYLRLNWEYRNIIPGCRVNCRAWIKLIRATRS